MTTKISPFWKLDQTLHPECHIKSLHLVNYKAAKEISLTFGHRLHILIGENGSGKTTILDGIRLLLSFIRIKPEESLIEMSKTIFHKNSKGQLVDECSFHISLGSGEHKQTITKDSFLFPKRKLIDLSVLEIGDNQTANHWYNNQTKTDLPLFLYYGNNRTEVPIRSSQEESENIQELAIEGSLDDEKDYHWLVEWFDTQERTELYEMRERNDVSYRSPLVQAIRDAVAGVLPDVRDLRYEPNKKELLAYTSHGSFLLSDLSSGELVTISLVADIARRMMQGNPHLGCKSPAIILIDEIDLHLHPKWQQTILEKLMTVFPAAQFIVTTHSEQIIASVPSELITIVSNQKIEGITAYSLPPSEGASYDRILRDVMGLDTRRPILYQKELDRYWQLISENKGKDSEALELRKILDAVFKGQEPELVNAGLAIRRQAILARRERKK